MKTLIKKLKDKTHIQVSKGNCAITLPNDTISSDKLLPLLRQGWYEVEKQGFKEVLGSCTLESGYSKGSFPWKLFNSHENCSSHAV